MAIPCSPEAGRACDETLTGCNSLPDQYWSGMTLAATMWVALMISTVIITG